MDHGGTPVTSVAQLEALIGQPLPAARNKVRDRLHELDRASRAEEKRTRGGRITWIRPPLVRISS